MRLSRTATMLSCLAIFVALGGTASAARWITGKQIKDGSLSGKDIRDRSIARRDLGFSTSMRVVTVDGPTVHLQPDQSTYDVDPNGFQASCPSGTTVVGTGFDGGVGATSFVKSYDSFVGGFMYNDTTIDYDVSLQAICAGGGGAVAVSERGRQRARARYARDQRRFEASLTGSARFGSGATRLP